jgi:ribosomal-protein-alanine N-acetyltransferase
MKLDASTFPILATERLILRDVQVSDATDVLVFRGDPIVQRFDDPAIHTVAEAEAFIVDELQGEYHAGDGITWGVTLAQRDVVLGLFGFHRWDHFHRRAEIGYGLARTHWGRGLGSEALRAIVGFGFQQMELNRIYARTIADNHESVRLLERLGFQHEGTQRAHSLEDDGTFHDSAIYGMLTHEFVAPE